MSLKSSLVLVVGFVIFGIALQTSAVSNNQEELPQNAITVAIKELIQLLSALGKEAMDEFSKALDQLKSFVNDTLSTIKTEPTKTIEKLVDDIIAAKHKAGKHNVNISKCASDQSIAELKNIPQVYLNQTAECTDSVIQSATEDVNKAKINLNEIIKEVKELLSEGLKCGWNLVCWASLANKVLKYAIALPREMAALVTNTVKLIYDLGSKVLECKVFYGTKAAAQAVKIATNTTRCIFNAINNKNSTII